MKSKFFKHFETLVDEIFQKFLKNLAIVVVFVGVVKHVVIGIEKHLQFVNQTLINRSDIAFVEFELK